MIKNILAPEIQIFINHNLEIDINKLALQKNPFPSIEWSFILSQIESKKKAKEKLPTWFSTQNIIYPQKISIEQSSSETTAKYKASLISGESLIDMTGGFGVDDFYFAKKISTITHCEINETLSQITSHNYIQLDVKNINCVCGDSETILLNSKKHWDWIYIDPSRRNEKKGKVFMLNDCLPNVPKNLNLYFTKSTAILIKTAPLLDITAGLSELKNVKTIHIIALNNEVKELLWELHKDFNGDVSIKTVNITKNSMEYFTIPKKHKVAFQGLPELFLYEPNSAIMKSGAFDAVSTSFNLKKLHSNSHLYTNSSLIDFPGRRFKIDKIMKYSKSELKEYFFNKKANITTRNFPETVDQIRKKWKIKEGGNCYSFFTTDINNHKIVLICSKI